MSKLYVFAIGGSGARVFNQFIMMLASGLDLGEITEVRPILIDLDVNHMIPTNILCEKYLAIHEKYWRTGNSQKKFFGTKISKIQYTMDSQQLESFIFPLKIDNNQEQFRQYICYNSMSEKNADFASLLFSDDNLNTNLEMGCKGQPNIGSVIFCNEYQNQNINEALNGYDPESDRVCIVSSCFGGTGAAGFPALIKKISEMFHDTVFIGAVSIQPYFKVEGEIDSPFPSRVQVALDYYRNHILDSKVLYFAGDKDSNDANVYERNIGSIEQVVADKAHLVEFTAAAAIIDFARKEKRELTSKIEENGMADSTNRQSGRYIYGNDENNLPAILNFKYIFNRGNLETDIRKHTSAFYLFSCFLKNSPEYVLAKDQLWVDRFKVSGDKLNDFASFCCNCTKNCFQIFTEMAEIPQKFKPFNECRSEKNAMSVRNDIPGKNLSAGGCFLGFWKKTGYAYILRSLNENTKSSRNIADLFSKVFLGIISKKYGNR